MADQEKNHTVLVTGAAGFIGFHLSKALLEKGNQVIGVDNLNPYYDVSLKKARLDLLKPLQDFVFYKEDIQSRRSFRNTLLVASAIWQLKRVSDIH
jgi:UDP-glucuronate 4-epimerase